VKFRRMIFKNMDQTGIDGRSRLSQCLAGRVGMLQKHKKTSSPCAESIGAELL